MPVSHNGIAVNFVAENNGEFHFIMLLITGHYFAAAISFNYCIYFGFTIYIYWL